MLLADFTGFGHGYCLNIRLLWIEPGVVLMIALCGMERAERFKRGDDRPREVVRLVQFANLGGGDLPLLVAGCKDRGAILRANIVPLAIELRRIVGVEEDVEQLFLANLPRIVSDANRLRVTRVAVANRFVVRGLRGAADVAARHVEHAAQLLKRRLRTPEAAAGEDGSGSVVWRH